MYEFRWIAWNLAKLDTHNIDRSEAECLVRHPPRGYPKRVEDDKSIVRGQTQNGAYIQVIYVVNDDGRIFVIHARPLNANEKRAFRRGSRP